MIIVQAIILALAFAGCSGDDESPTETFTPTPPPPSADAARVCAMARDGAVAYCSGCLGYEVSWCQVYGFNGTCDGTRAAAFSESEYRAMCEVWWRDRLAQCDIGQHPSGEPPSCTSPFEPEDVLDSGV